MKKRSVLDQIVLCADGSVHMRFLKQVVDSDGTIIASIPHMAVAASWEDPEKVMAFADQRLSLKHAPVEKADKDWCKAATKGRRKPK